MYYTGSVPNSQTKSDDIGITPLNGDGEFRSQECIDILKEGDVVAAYPPFLPRSRSSTAAVPIKEPVLDALISGQWGQI